MKTPPVRNIGRSRRRANCDAPSTLTRISVLLTIVLLPACCWWPEESRTSTYEERYLPYRQPSRDRSYPAMTVLRDEGDGTYWELPRHFDLGLEGRSFEWGKTYKVQVTSTYNPTWQSRSKRVDKIIEETETIADDFRLHSISAPFFGENKRSFVDGKAFVCASEDVCEAVDTAIATDERFDMKVAFGKSASEPLVVNSIESATCYSVNDCTVREECCDTKKGFVCEKPEACPADKRVGVDRAEYIGKKPK